MAESGNSIEVLFYDDDPHEPTRVTIWSSERKRLPEKWFDNTYAPMREASYTKLREACEKHGVEYPDDDFLERYAS
jgi:hypothetical protein